MNRDADIPEPLLSGAPIEVGTRQTTYRDVSTQNAAARYRIHFINKVEFEFVTSPADKITIANDHPLLIEYLEPEDALYISSKPDDPESSIDELSRVADSYFLGWRPLSRYLNEHVSAAEILTSGYGLLLRGPRGFVEAAESVLAAHGVQRQLHKGSGFRGRFRVLELGRNFVVAERFEFERIAHAA